MCNDKEKIWDSANEIVICGAETEHEWAWRPNICPAGLLYQQDQRFYAMETHSHRTDKDGRPQAEENYPAHEENPAPSPEAINEPNDRPASNTIWVSVIVAIIIMALIYFIFIY